MPTEIIKSPSARPATDAKPLRVLALDGGGMRGYYTVACLQNLCERFAAKNCDGARFDLGAAFDVFVGASTGSIIAAGLAAGRSPSEISEFYATWGPRIFTAPIPDFDTLSEFARKIAAVRFMWTNLSHAFNDDAVLRLGLEELFDEQTFGTVYGDRKKALLIPAVDMRNHKAWVFKTSHIPGKHRDENTPLVEACLASAAAPFFFPLAIYQERPFADGGIIANNPILLGAIEALEMTPGATTPIEIVSVGTCPPPVGQHATPNTRSWGFEQWQMVRRFSEVVLDAQVSMHVDTMKFLLRHINRSITIFRLHQSKPNETEARKLGLDRADPEALTILRRRASTDAEQIRSEVYHNGELAPLSEIFSNLR